MIPLWMNFLGVSFLKGLQNDNVHLTVPYMRLVSILVGLLVPLMIGVAIARYRPTWAARARKVGAKNKLKLSRYEFFALYTF